MKHLIILLALFSFNVYAEPVDINSADAETISQSLKGIGLIKAAEIVKYRTKNGAFKTIDDLRNVKGIGEKIIKNNSRDILLSKTKVRKKAKIGKKAKTSKKAKIDKKIKKEVKKKKNMKEKKAR